MYSELDLTTSEIIIKGVCVGGGGGGGGWGGEGVGCWGRFCPSLLYCWYLIKQKYTYHPEIIYCHSRPVLSHKQVIVNSL